MGGIMDIEDPDNQWKGMLLPSLYKICRKRGDRHCE